MVASKISQPPILPLIERCSTLGKAIRVVVYVHRFIKNWFLKPPNFIKGPMLAEEVLRAMGCLAKVTQEHFFG